MLISNIETMKSVKAKAPGFVGFYIIKNGFENLVAGGKIPLFLSVDGSLKGLPVFSKWETCIVAEGCGISNTGDVVRVIEGSPEIVESIAKNGGGMLWKGEPRFGACRLQPAVLVLGPKSFHVVTDVVPEDGFELVDVMFGPFHL